MTPRRFSRSIHRTSARDPGPRRRLALQWIGAVGSALLSGCAGSLLPKPPPAPARFTLDDGLAEADAAAMAPAAAAGLAAPGTAGSGVASSGVTSAGVAGFTAASAGGDGPVLIVAVPRAAPGHGGMSMVYTRRPHELASFAFHEWIDTPARMLAPLLVRSIQATGAFRAVLLAPSAAEGQWRLETELLRLQHDFTRSPSQVRLTLRAVLVDSATRRVIAGREFDEIVPAATDDPVGGVHAARQSAQRLRTALANFCAEQTRR